MIKVYSPIAYIKPSWSTFWRKKLTWLSNKGWTDKDAAGLYMLKLQRENPIFKFALYEIEMEEENK